VMEYRCTDTIYVIDIINESYDHQKVLVSAHAGFFDVFMVAGAATGDGALGSFI
jgi:hypothetical protein